MTVWTGESEKMEHESILYGPVNALWGHRFGVDIPDHVIMALLVLLLSAILLPLLARSISKDKPGFIQQMMELVVGGLRGLMEDIIGHGAASKYLPIIGAFTVFIFLSNIFGLFYFLQPPTANINTTVALALVSFLYFNWQGIRSQGVLHYLAHFAGPVLFLAPIMFPIEIVGNVARVLSLSMRLFGNIMGEHTASGIFFGLFPIVVPWPMMALGIFGAVLQTFVFIMLTMVYIGGATATEEH
jgi:F-type H+-transporting ATPase subunit a